MLSTASLQIPCMIKPYRKGEHSHLAATPRSHLGWLLGGSAGKPPQESGFGGWLQDDYFSHDKNKSIFRLFNDVARISRLCTEIS